MAIFRTSLSAVLVTGPGPVLAQPDATARTRLVGSNDIDSGYAAAGDPAGHGIPAGATQGILAGGDFGRYDLFVARCDSTGNRAWLVRRGTAECDFACGALFLGGTTAGSLGDETRGWRTPSS